MGEDNPFDPFLIHFLNSSGIFGDMVNRDLHPVRCNESADVSNSLQSLFLR